jgi:hypothetical protein
MIRCRNLYAISALFKSSPDLSQASKYPEATIYGGSDKVSCLTNLVKDKDEFTIGSNIHVK